MEFFESDQEFWTIGQPNGWVDCAESFELGLLERNHLFKKTFQLSRYYFIELFENRPLRYRDLRRTVFEAFFEENGKENLYGFRLNREEFFVNCPETLDAMIDNFSDYCVLTTFEEDFVVIKPLGQGSSCSVLLVQSTKDQLQYAAKCIKKSFLFSKPSLSIRLMQEIKILQDLDHPNIVRLHHIYETFESIYLIQEYLPHGDLYKRIVQNKKASEELSARFARSLFETLEYLHSKSVVHRDLKLENIMMTSHFDYSFKIIDFGLSYQSSERQEARCGSPGYIAPEVLEGKSYDQKIDIFSAGVLIYVLLTGTHPFNGSSSMKILNNNANCVYKCDGILRGLAKEFIKSCLQRDPEKRQDAWKMLEHPWLGKIRRGSVCTAMGGFSTVCGSIIAS